MRIKTQHLSLSLPSYSATISLHYISIYYLLFPHMSFVHLHNHSYYSLLQSPTSPAAIAARAKEMGSPAVALTDNGVMYGGIEFYKACKGQDIKPIFGMEAFIAPRTLHHKENKADGRPWSLVLLAENQEGYENLLKLATIAHMEGFYYKPRIDLEVLEKHKKGLIALSGGFRGEIPNAILEGFLEEDVEAIIQKYLNIFGKKNFFFELGYHPNLQGQIELNEKLFELGKKHGVGIVAAQNAYYSKEDEAEAQDILMCIGTNRLVDDYSRPTMVDEDYSLTDASEIVSAFEDMPEAIENTLKIADRCNVEFDLGSYQIPDFNPPKEHPTSNPVDYFRYECIEGMKKRYPKFEEHLETIGWKTFKDDTTGIKNEEDRKYESIQNPENPTGEELALRFEHEFRIIKNMGFESYFLIVWDYIKWAHDNGVLVGPGRGSGAGSIIAFALGITNLEPLRYNLLFERFLNPERVSMPDFDIDFQDDRRGEVIDYVTRKYGEDHVAQISTFGTMAARAAVKDVGRALGMPFGQMNDFAKLIPERPGTKLKEAWDQEVDLRNAVDANPDFQKIWKNAEKLEGCVRHISVHACAVVIAPQPLSKYTAIQHPPKDDKTIISQFSAKPLESLGLLKMDFLGLKNLTILDRACQIIKKNTGRIIDLDDIPVDDAKTFEEIFQTGSTTGVFQFESAGMKRYLKELKPTVFEDLIAMNSLYRPGPMEFIPDFINRKHGKVTVEYPHESVEEILTPTYGIAVYQEQILQMAQYFSGYSLGQADLLRRAIGKKIPEEMDKQRTIFIEKAEELGRAKKTAEYLFDKVIVPFAGYGFNKSHAAAYSLVAYQTAHLKAHYPTEFMAALLTSDQSNSERVAIEIEECREMEIDVLAPSVNESLEDFTVVKNRQIRFGLGAIKNLGDSAIDAIIEARGEENIPFKDLEDFLDRVEVTQLNRKNLEALICSGAMDELGERNQMLENMDEMIEFAKESHQKESTGQIGLFDFGGEDLGGDAAGLTLNSTEKASFSQRLSWEKEFLGLFVSSHPLAGLTAYWEKKGYSFLKDITPKDVGETKKFAGTVTGLRLIRTKKDDQMAVFTLDAPTGKIDVAVFPTSFKEAQKYLQEDHFIIVTGKIDHRNGNLQLIAEKCFGKTVDELRKEAEMSGLLNKEEKYLKRSPLQAVSEEDIQDAKREPWVLDIPHGTSKTDLGTIKGVFDQNPGKFQVILVFPTGQRYEVPQKVNVTKVLKSHVAQILHGADKQKENRED